MARNLRTVAQFAGDTPFTEAQLRWWIFNERTNGLADYKATVRIGRRVYIDPDRFNEWIDSQQRHTEHTPSPSGKAKRPTTLLSAAA